MRLENPGARYEVMNASGLPLSCASITNQAVSQRQLIIDQRFLIKVNTGTHSLVDFVSNYRFVLSGAQMGKSVVTIYLISQFMHIACSIMLPCTRTTGYVP